MRYGVSAIVVREPDPKILAAVDGLIPGATVSLRTDCFRATSRVLVSTFQPRTSTLSEPSAPVSTARRASRLFPYSRTIGLRVADVDGEGAEDAGSGLVNCSTPLSSTRTVAPLSAARCWRNSQSETLGWVSCLYVIDAASTFPQASPAPAATLRTMSAVFMFRYASTFRPRWSRCALENARTTVNDPVVSVSSSIAVTSPVNSRSRARSWTVTTEILNGVPMPIPVLARNVWSGSRYIRTAVSGSPTFSSTTQLTNWVAQAAGSSAGASTIGSAAKDRPGDFVPLITRPLRGGRPRPGTSSSRPGVNCIGSSMSLACAMVRHAVASPYSRQASSGRLSPATTRCVRRASFDPEVGFCPAGSTLASSIDREQVARSGFPSTSNSVYETERLESTPSNDVVFDVPQSNRTQGLAGVLRARLLGVGTHAVINCSTAFSTELSWVAVASRNTSSDRARGPLPTNSGSADCPAIRDGVRRHSVVLLSDSFAGLNCNVSRASVPPGLAPTVDGGSMMVSWARARLARRAGDTAFLPSWFRDCLRVCSGLLRVCFPGTAGSVSGCCRTGAAVCQEGSRPSCAISNVSIAAWESAGSKDGPCQRTGTIP